MTTEQKAQFELELNQDIQLQNELKLAQEVNNAIKTELQVTDFKNKLAQIHQKEFGKSKSKVVHLQNKWYWAAASITIATGAGTYSLNNYLNQPDQLYNKYYSTWQPALATRSVNNTIENNIIKKFEEAEFKQAISLINELPTENLTPKLILIKGCALMETNKFEEAIVAFESFNSSNYTLYTETGNWYKALCFIKLNKTNKAVDELNKIADSDNTFSSSAQKLLKKMN